MWKRTGKCWPGLARFASSISACSSSSSSSSRARHDATAKHQQPLAFAVMTPDPSSSQPVFLDTKEAPFGKEELPQVPRKEGEVRASRRSTSTAPKYRLPVDKQCHRCNVLAIDCVVWDGDRKRKPKLEPRGSTDLDASSYSRSSSAEGSSKAGWPNRSGQHDHATASEQSGHTTPS